MSTGGEPRVVAEESKGGEPVVTTEEKYDLHIRLDKEMQQVLRDAAELAYEMGDIPKADLVDLINLFIGLGLSVQKKRWLDRMGYK